MALTNEDLLAISQLMDMKFKSNLAPIENRLSRLDDRLTTIEITLENDILQRLKNIESCYTSTYERYQDYGDKMQAAFGDIELLKKVVAEHSEKLKKIS